MVTTTTHRTRTAIALVALLTFLFGVAPQMKAADQLTKKQAKALAATAKTPADHMRLAAYYKLEADRLDAEAKDHDDLAQVYRLTRQCWGEARVWGTRNRVHSNTARPLRNRCERPRNP